jgi:hypothetical protein
MRRAWTRRARARTEVQLPLQRYFLFAGGALLILLFATDWIVPPLKGEHVKAEVRLPVIRIHSERKGPEAVVFDTTKPIFVAPVELDGAAPPRAVASNETSATEAVVQQSGSMPKSIEPAKLSSPKTKHWEISFSAHAPLMHRPLHHPASLASSNTMFAASESHMREAFAQAPAFPRVPLPRTPDHVKRATQDLRE